MFRNNERTKADQGEYATDLFRRESVRFIRDNHTRPFFLYLAFNAPHVASNLERDSYQVPQHYLDKYYPGQDHSNNRIKYAGMVSAMDEAIGDVFATLRDLSLDRNTLVVFMADNGNRGGSIDAVPLRGGKANAFEGGLRVPLIAWWPGVIPAGRTTHEFLTALEILPTFQAVSGAFPLDVHLDGFDMLAVLQGKERSPREEMFWHWPDGYKAARVGQYKWVSYWPRGNPKNLPPKEELFDLSTDLREAHNLINEKPEVLERVLARVARWEAEMEAAEPRGPFRPY